MKWLAAAAAAVECQDGSKLLYQVQEEGVVVNVLEQSGKRLLVLSNASDVSASTPDLCRLGWWMDHEVQGSVSCLASASSPALLAGVRRASPCPPCTADVEHVDNGYIRSMAALAVLTNEGKQRQATTSLVIGLGAGLYPSWLARQSKEATVDVVDISPGVVQAAPCFGLAASPRLRLHVSDGRVFLQQQEQTYDTIVVDAFDGTAEMPMCMRTKAFFALCAKRLNEGGKLLLNLVTCESDTKTEDCSAFRDSVIASVQSAFPRTHVADAPGSAGSQVVLVAQQGAEKVRTSAVPDQAHRWLEAARVRPLPAVDPKLAVETC